MILWCRETEMERWGRERAHPHVHKKKVQEELDAGLDGSTGGR